MQENVVINQSSSVKDPCVFFCISLIKADYFLTAERAIYALIALDSNTLLDYNYYTVQ